MEFADYEIFDDSYDLSLFDDADSSDCDSELYLFDTSVISD